MSPYLRKVKTASGATAVQVVVKENGVRRIVEHLGSAHDEAELAALMHLGRQRVLAGQQVLDLGSALDGGGQAPSHEPGDGGVVRRPAIISRRSGWLIEAIKTVYARLGLGEAVGGDRAFEQMVVARLIEPTSKADTPRVLSEIGWPAPAHRNTLQACLARTQERGYRQAISQALFDHVTAGGGLALCLYDVTTLYFEAEREDGLRRVGYSKERRVDPQIIVGLLVDRHGFPLQVGCWEGNKAETTTIIPIVEAFQAAHGIEDLVVVAGRRHALSRQPDGPGRRSAAVHRPGPDRSAPRATWRRTSTGKAMPSLTGRSSTPSPPEEARTPSGTRVSRLSRCGTRTPIQARGEPSGSTPRSARPGTTRPSQLRRIAPGPSSPARSVPRARVLSPSIKAIRSSMRRPSPGPGPWWASRATSPTFLHA